VKHCTQHWYKTPLLLAIVKIEIKIDKKISVAFEMQTINWDTCYKLCSLQLCEYFWHLMWDMGTVRLQGKGPVRRPAHHRCRCEDGRLIGPHALKGLNPWLPCKGGIQQKEDSCHQQIGLKFKEETMKVLHLEHGFVWRWKLDMSESRSEIPGKFWNVMLEKGGECQLEGSCEKWSITKS
jgi:hypothetical protein